MVWSKPDLAWIAAALALVVALAALLAWRRAVRILGTRVLIGEAMRRQGITPAQAAAAGLEAELFDAQRKCAHCTSDAECRTWLAVGRGSRPPEGCLNQSFFEEVGTKKPIMY